MFYEIEAERVKTEAKALNKSWDTTTALLLPMHSKKKGEKKDGGISGSINVFLSTSQTALHVTREKFHNYIY